jgi:hypothetical protein
MKKKNLAEISALIKNVVLLYLVYKGNKLFKKIFKNELKNISLVELILKKKMKRSDRIVIKERRY